MVAKTLLVLPRRFARAYTGGAPPDLRYSPPEVHRDWYAIVLGGSRADKGMLGFTSIKSAVPTQMTPQEADALHAYIIDRSWKAYNEQQNEQSRQK